VRRPKLASIRDLRTLPRRRFAAVTFCFIRLAGLGVNLNLDFPQEERLLDDSIGYCPLVVCGTSRSLGREVGQPVESALRKTKLDDDVLAFDLPELAQPLPERLEEVCAGDSRAASEIAYAVDLSHRLGAGG
jgi:hypothetical protein